MCGLFHFIINDVAAKQAPIKRLSLCGKSLVFVYR